jgi:hypothetical protein
MEEDAVDEFFGKYEAAAVFIGVLLRLIYDGPKLNQGSLVLDEATALDLYAVVARFAELTQEEPVTADMLAERLHRVRAIADHSRADVQSELEETTVCISVPPFGLRCYHIYTTRD